MFRRLTVVLISAFLVLLAGPAYAAPTTETHHAKGVVETFVDVVPSCEGGGPLYTITTRANTVEHVTEFADGREHVTFSETGTFRAVPLDDATLPTYGGKFNVSGSFNVNRSTVNGTFTFNVRGIGSDGSRFSNHNVEHFNVRPSGSVHEFFHCR